MVGIKLLPIEKEDLPLLQSWRNSKDVMPYCRQYRPLSMRDMEKWFTQDTTTDYNLTNDLLLISCNCDCIDNKKIGVGGFVRIDWRNRKGELSFYVGESSQCSSKIISKALLAVVGYGFKTLGFHKIYFPCYAENPYLPIYTEILTEEYIAKEEYYWEGKFHDRIILSMFEDEYKRRFTK